MVNGSWRTLRSAHGRRVPLDFARGKRGATILLSAIYPVSSLLWWPLLYGKIPFVPQAIEVSSAEAYFDRFQYPL